jgi:hypothetical protein
MANEYNELQVINSEIDRHLKKEAKRQRDNLILWYETELANANMATQYKSLDAFSASDWNTSSTSSTVGGMVAGTEAGLGSIYALSSVSETSRYFLDLQTKGVTLSSTLRDSARDAEKLALDAINKHLNSKTTVARLTKELTSKNVSKGDLPKFLKELSDEIRIVGGDTAKMKRLIKQAEVNIAKLAQNGAPTSALKKSYSKVLDQVKRGDVESLNNALKVAIDKKAVYNNQRIARTELSKAYSKGFARQLEDHDLGERAFVRISLNSGHSITDVCDYITGADLHNRGAGVYPQDSVPQIPLHPNCICLYSIAPVRDIDGRKTQFSQKNSDAYMSKLTERERKQVEYSKKHTDIKKLLPLPKTLVVQTELDI